MPIEAYEIVDGTHVAVPAPGSAPPSNGGQESAPDANGTGTPGAPPETPAGSTESSVSPTDTPPASSGEGDADTDDEPLRDDSEVNAERLNRRFARLTAARRKAERERDALAQQHQVELAQTRGQLEMVQRLLQGNAPPLPETPAPPTGPPEAAQFADHESYDRAAARYEAQAVVAQERQQAAIQARHARLPALEAPVKAQYADYDAVVLPLVQGNRLAPHLQQLLFWHDGGPTLAYALGKDPQLLARVNQLPPPLALLELGALLPRSSAPANGTTDATPPTPPPVANGTPPAAALPPPLTPLSGSSAGAPTASYTENMDQAAYRAWRKRTSDIPTWKDR